MGSNREMIQSFVNGQLSEADHDLMAHHIATCEQCAAAVAAERAVRGELAKLLAQPDAPAVPSPVVNSADLSVPPVPELQLDFVLDRTAEAAELLLPREPVREVALDQLPPAPAHSERRSERGGARAEAEREGERGAQAGVNSRVAYADDTEVAAATAAGIADSVAHAAAALASDSPWEPLEVGVDEAAPAGSTLAAGIEYVAVVEEPGSARIEDVADVAVVEAPSSALIEDMAEVAVVEEPSFGLIEHVADAAVVEEPSSALIEDVADVAVVEEPSSALIEDVVVVEDAAPAQMDDVSVVGDSGLAAVSSVAARRKRPTRLWGALAAALVIGLVSVYAAGQLRSSEGTGVAAAAAGQLEQVAEADVEWRMVPSVLMPILDSAVYNRVVDVTAIVDSPADSVDAADVPGRAALEGTAPSTSRTGPRPVPPTRRPRAAERLPQIVSDPPDADDPPPRPPPGEALPEVMKGNPPARTTTRGSAVVISGVPDVPRLLRTTTHRPRRDVAYVLREYDASGAEPAPRAGVNEYRWSDATGSRFFVLSGPDDVAELRAYARRLQTR